MVVELKSRTVLRVDLLVGRSLASVSAGRKFSLFLVVVLLLPGCGVMDYFTGDEVDPAKTPTKQNVSKSPAKHGDAIDSESTLLHLERFLIDRAPALEHLRSEIGTTREQEGGDALIPGSIVSDSANIDQRELADQGDGRRLAINLRPSALLEGERRQRARQSRSALLSASLREVESKLLRLLREEWSEIWFQQQVLSMTQDALGELELAQQESDFDSSSPVEPILLETLKSRWNDRVDGIKREARKTHSRINDLLGRSARSVLPHAAGPGDDRFQHIDQLTDRRLHPREIMAVEELALASAHLEDIEGSGWPDIVVGAQSNTDIDAPVTGSSGLEDSWTFTVGVEFPLGQQRADLRRREARSRFGSATALQVLARRAVEDEIAAARAQLLASLQRLEEIEEDV
ncbi:MAG: TolC family protein, partial [Planctomycetota bacterium]